MIDGKTPFVLVPHVMIEVTALSRRSAHIPWPRRCPKSW